MERNWKATYAFVLGLVVVILIISTLPIIGRPSPFAQPHQVEVDR